jgi:NAD-dependent deacetylase
MMTRIDRLARRIARAGRIAVLTGAGVSVESGIPPFRGRGGLWERFDPMEYATIGAFLNDPGKVWRVMLGELNGLIMRARPGAGHIGLAKLEALGKSVTVITQNVDGLHQQAGSSAVIELHGTFARLRCLNCGAVSATAATDLGILPPRCPCGGILRPACIFFGEEILPSDLLRSRQASAGCDLMLVIGTSANVHPAALMPLVAKQAGAAVVEINPEPTALTGRISDELLCGKAGEVMPPLLAAVQATLTDFGRGA